MCAMDIPSNSQKLNLVYLFLLLLSWSYFFSYVTDTVFSWLFSSMFLRMMFSVLLLCWKKKERVGGEVFFFAFEFKLEINYKFHMYYLFWSISRLSIFFISLPIFFFFNKMLSFSDTPFIRKCCHSQRHKYINDAKLFHYCFGSALRRKPYDVQKTNLIFVVIPSI